LSNPEDGDNNLIPLESLAEVQEEQNAEADNFGEEKPEVR